MSWTWPDDAASAAAGTGGAGTASDGQGHNPPRLAEAPAALRGIADDIEPRHALSAAVLRLVADDLTADPPDVGPAPDSWMPCETDDGRDALVPVWDLRSDVRLDGADSVVAWRDGVEGDGALSEGSAVDAVEQDAYRLLAAVAWHRRMAAHAAAPTGGDEDRV